MSCPLILLCACTTLGPDYSEPDVAWLGDWQPDLYGQLNPDAPKTAADMRFWWQLFEDSTLNNLIETAQRQNPSLRIAGLRILESRAALGISTSLQYPQLQQISGAASRVTIDQSGGVTGDDNQNFTDYQLGFTLGWELDFWGRFRRGVESANAAYFAAITNQQDAQVLLNAQVADVYFAYRTTVLRIGIAYKNAEIQKRSFVIAQQLFEKGQSSELDLQQAKTQYLSTLSTIPDLEASLVQLGNALATLLGRAPGDLPELTDVQGNLPMLDPLIIHEIPADLLLRRPDIRTAAWQAAAQSAQIGIAKADFYPAISLFGSIGWSGNSLSASPDTLSLAAGPSFGWDVFSYGRIENNVRVQDVRLQQAIESFQSQVLQAAREIDNAAIRIVKTREQRQILLESTQAAHRSLELASTRYREGYADFQRVLDAQRAVAAQEERDIVNQGNHISAVIEFYKAIGGGWTWMPMQEMLSDETQKEMQTRTNWGDLLVDPLPDLPPATQVGESP